MDRSFRVARFRARVACVFTFLLIFAASTCAQASALPPALQKGVDWLNAQIQADGSLGSEGASAATPLQARAEAATTLAALAQAPSSLVGAIAANTDGNLEYRARRIIVAGNAAQGADVTAVLAQQNADGGWGLTGNFQSDPLDTAFALLALRAANSAATTPVANALAYLSQAKSGDGGWGISGQSSIYVSANVLLAANAWASQYSTASITTSAATWLVGARGAAQDFGDTFDNAYGLMALATQSAQSAALPPLMTALNTAQLSDGSWADDPYLTALALKALWYANQPPTTPNTGNAQGVVIDQATGLPLSGATVSLAQNAGISATTASDGSFHLANIPPANYTLQVAHTGYQARSLNIAISAGQTLNVGSVALSPNATTATLSGVVKNNSGQVLQNVIVTVGTASTLTDATGAYQLSGLAVGAATIKASLTGYQTVTASATFVAGGSYLFSPTLYPSNVTPPPASLQGLVVDSVSKAPIAGASVVLNGVTMLSDAGGKFVFASVTTGAYVLTISASGHQTTTASISLVAGVNDIGTIALQPTAATTTLTGKILDAQGNPINNATVAVDKGPSATSDNTGAYQLTGLSGTQFTIQVSAAGFVTQTFAFTITAPGEFTQDFHLVAQTTNQVTLGALTVAPASAGANTDLSVSTTLVNGGSVQFDGVLLLEVYDAANHLIGSGPLTDTSGFTLGAVTLQPGDHLGIIGRWNTGLFAPGNYQFEMRLVQPGTINRGNPLGTLIQNQFAPFAITATTHFTGTVAANPPVVQAGLNQPVNITAVIKNDGNVTFAAQSMALTVADAKSGAIAFSATANLDALAANGLANLDFGNWIPATGGNYQLNVVATDATQGKVTGSVYVGNVAQASFTATPDTVLAGTRTVHGNIHVTGVNPAQATITDPLAPLIKTAIQKAVTFNDKAAHTWIDTNRCSSCHIGNQALIGGELTRQLTTYNAFDRNVILNNISTNQAPNGGIWEGYSTYEAYGRRLGSLSLWGLSSYHNLGEFPTVIKRAADWVVGFQSANGEWQSDWNGAWFDNDVSMSMLNLSNLHHAHEFLKSNAITAVPTYVSQPLLANQPASSRAFMIVASTGNIYYTDASGASVNLIKPDGTLLTRWTGFSDPRCTVERKDGQVWLSTGNGTYRLNPDGTSTRLASGNFNSLEIGPDGTVWGVAYPDNTLYKLDANGVASAWLSNGPFSSVVFVNPDADGSLYVTDRNYGKIYHVLPDKSVSVAVEVMQGPGSQPALIQLMRDGDHWLLSTTNGIYRFSSAWEGQRLTWSGEVDQMAHLADGSVVFVAYGKAGIQKLVQQGEAVAPSLTKYENAISLGTNWLQTFNVGSTDTMHLAQKMWGLGEAYRFYQPTNAARAAAIRSTITTLATQLRANQNADGGWGRYSSSASDALVTAQTGIALDYLDPSASDPAIRKAVAWLLTQQQADGSWYSANGIMGTHESTTTMVAIWLPMILDRLGAIDTQVSATFPPNIHPGNIVPAPAHSTTDAAGNLLASWTLTGVTDTGRDLDFDLTLDNMLPNEVRPAATDAHMTFNNSFTQQPIDVPIAIPNITANAPVSLSVVTDQPAYAHNATAQVTTALVNLDAVEVDGTLVVNVYDASGALVGGVTQQAVSIPASGTLPVTGPFAIGTILAAQYTVTAVLSNNGLVLAQGQTTFLVLPDNATASATSTVHTDKQNYNPTDQVLISSRAQSLSTNTILDNLSLVVKVYDAASTLQFSHSYAIAQLLPGASLDFSVTQPLTNAATGIYTVKQDLFDAQGQLFNHVEAAYNVSSTSVTGFGLVGTIAATPKTLPVGGTLALAATATNQGNGALTNLPLTITIIDPDQGTVLQSFNQTSTVAVGASVPFDTTWITQGHVGTTYFAVLSASIGSGSTARTITLAVDTFQLTLQLKADVTLQATPAPLAALVLVDANSAASETARITSALTPLGYTATFANTPADFAAGVRTGAYQLYLLLATQVAPDATTQRLLREAVHRGDGLVSANGVAALPDALAQITGLQASSALPVINAQSLDVLPGAPGGAAHVDFAPALASRIVVPQSAQTQATLTGRLPGTPDQGALADEVANLGRVDIGFFGVETGTNGTHLSLTSLGRIHNADGSDHFSVWRIRNSADIARNVTLASASAGYSAALAISPRTDTFVASPVVAGTADHSLIEAAKTIQSAAALTSVFADARLVDVGNNPGAIALWANAINMTDVFDWTGAQHQVHGAVHSNSDIRLAGAQNLLDGPVHYVTSFSNSGSQNTFAFLPRQVAAQPLPTLLNLDDFKPGGTVAASAGAQYFDQSAECTAKQKWHRTPSQMPLATGVYWIPCDVQIDGDSPRGTVTLVSTGAMQITGAKGAFLPFYQGVQFATSQAGAGAMQLSGSNTQVGGLVFVPHGTVQASGDAMVFQCSVIADQIRFAGSRTVIDARQCPYATVQRQAPAVLWNGFGSGRAAYSAFDWQAAIAQYEGATPSTLSNLFAGVLAHVAPVQNPLRSGTVMPLTATVQNLADPFTGTLKLAANDDSTFVPPTVSWALDFTPTQSTFQTQSNIRLGSGTSTTITATAAAATPVVVDPLKQTSVSVAHLGGESIDDLVAAASAISNPDAGLNAALVALQAAQASLTANDRAGALLHLLDAAEGCGLSTNSQADALRTRIDWLIWSTTH